MTKNTKSIGYFANVLLVAVFASFSFWLGSIDAKAQERVSLESAKSVHGNDPSQPHDHYNVGTARLVGSQQPGASSFSVTPETWGQAEQPLARYFAAAQRTGVRLASSDFQQHRLTLTHEGGAERFWDVWTSISSDGSNDGDVVRYFITDANGREHDIAVGTIWTGMVKLQPNQNIKIFLIADPQSPYLSLVEAPSMGGMSIVPMNKPAGLNVVRTQPFFLAWQMGGSGPLFQCARLGVEIIRQTGPGHVSVVIDGTVVKRGGSTVTGNGILFGLQNGSYFGGESECADRFTGQATCFRTREWFLLNLDNNLPNTDVTVVGEQFQVHTSNRGRMYIHLNGGVFVQPTPEQVLNGEFIPSQWTLAFAGGPLVVQGILNGQLGLYSNLYGTVQLSQDFQVSLDGGATLSTGRRINSWTTLGQLHDEARAAIQRHGQGNQEARQDLLKLAAILRVLNSTCRR